MQKCGVNLGAAEIQGVHLVIVDYRPARYGIKIAFIIKPLALINYMKGGT